MFQARIASYNCDLMLNAAKEQQGARAASSPIHHMREGSESDAHALVEGDVYEQLLIRV